MSRINDLTPKKLASDLSYTTDISNGRSPGLTMTWVACRGCRDLVPLHSVECESCGEPWPARVDRRAS